MWVFGDWGLVMPAAIDAKEGLATPEFTLDGKFDLQVRARLESHLRYFMETYLELGSYNPKIQYTPDHDYNMRIYTTREAFGAAMAKAVLDIDYRKFKPSSERPGANGRPKYGKDAHLYHSVLNSIWSVVCRLATPGDVWGPWTPENPRGYKSSRHLFGSSYSRDDDSTVYDEPFETLSKDEERQLIISAMDGVPADQWDEYLDERDLALVSDIVKQATKRNRRHRRKRITR